MKVSVGEEAGGELSVGLWSGTEGEPKVVSFICVTGEVIEGGGFVGGLTVGCLLGTEGCS